MAVENIVLSATDGPTLTGASRLSCIPTANRVVLPNNFFYIGRAIQLRLGGRISCAVTTPGTCRFDVCMGAAGTTVVYDTLAFNLNVVAKVTVPWFLDITLVCRAVGNGVLTTFFPHNCFFQSEALVGSPLPAVGSNGSLIVPVGTPAVGAGMDNTAASALDVFHTQTVATGQIIVHNYEVNVLN